MIGQRLYVIEYEHRGKTKSFVIRLEKMDNAIAWHWASCDAGVGIIPRFGQQKTKMVSRPLAERHGIVEVKWRLADSGTDHP